VLLYHELEIEHGNNKPMDLLSFRDEVGVALLHTHATYSPRNSVGRPKRSADQSFGQPPPQKRQNTEWSPCSDVQYDEVVHWLTSIVAGRAGKCCKLENCTGRSRIQCEKCKSAFV